MGQVQYGIYGVMAYNVEIWIEIQNYAIKEVLLKMAPAPFSPYCSGPNVLTLSYRHAWRAFLKMKTQTSAYTQLWSCLQRMANRKQPIWQM